MPASKASSNPSFFDAAWYARTYPDVELVGLTPLEHYLRIGSRLDRPPNGHAPVNESSIDELSSPDSGALLSLLRVGEQALESKNSVAVYAVLDQLVNAKPRTENHAIAEKYLLAQVYFQKRACSEAVRIASELEPSEPCRQLLGEKRIAHLQVSLALGLCRLSRKEDARGMLKKAATIVGPKLYSERLFDITWAGEPDVAVNVAMAARGEGLLLQFSFDLATMELLLASGRATEAAAFLASARKRAKKDIQQAECALAASNVASSSNTAFDLRPFWKLFGLRQPVLNASATRLTLSNIVNAEPPQNPKKKGPLVTVVITTFNAESTIDYSLSSIRSQTHAHLEIFVVDDCSSDRTRELIEAHAAADPRIKLLKNTENLGTYGSKNRAIQIATGEYITCHDADDWAHPERIARHVEFMVANPRLKASRSLWVRISPEGIFNMTRWKRAYLHPNPASLFFSRDVVAKIGYFDSVRAGADSEYYERLRAALGPESFEELKAPLALGLRHPQSLTTSGAAAIDNEGYSETRDKYCLAWLRWHRSAAPTRKLHLLPGQFIPSQDQSIGNTFESASNRLISDPATDAPARFVFGISLASAKNGNWSQTCRLLSNTLRSALAVKDDRVAVVIAGHERPEIPEMQDKRVTFFSVDRPPPKDPSGFRKDKMWKRFIIADHLRALGGGYFMPLDADDLVSDRLVPYAFSQNAPHGYIIKKGYAMDWAAQRLAPIPGVWSAPFDNVCGSCAIFRLFPRDLPSKQKEKNADAGSYFDNFESHAYWSVIAQEFGRPLQEIDFPAVVYVLNHTANLSFARQRTSVRQTTILTRISENEIPFSPHMKSEFGLEAATRTP